MSRATVALAYATTDGTTYEERETTHGVYADGLPRPSYDYGPGTCPCGAPLSRYNPHTVCVVCIANNRRAASPRVLPTREARPQP